MKTKFLLIAISCIALLSFISCEKELDRDITGGGGKEDANITAKFPTKPTLKDNQTTLVPDTILKVDE